MRGAPRPALRPAPEHGRMSQAPRSSAELVEEGVQPLEADGGAVLDPAGVGLQPARAGGERGVGDERDRQGGAGEGGGVVGMEPQLARRALLGPLRVHLPSLSHEMQAQIYL